MWLVGAVVALAVFLLLIVIVVILVKRRRGLKKRIEPKNRIEQQRKYPETGEDKRRSEDETNLSDSNGDEQKEEGMEMDSAFPLEFEEEDSWKVKSPGVDVAVDTSKAAESSRERQLSVNLQPTSSIITTSHPASVSY